VSVGIAGHPAHTNSTPPSSTERRHLSDLAQRGVAVASGPTERAAAAALEAVADVALLEGDLPTSLDAYEAVTALATPTDLAELADAPAN
jgi:hypothetical protein